MHSTREDALALLPLLGFDLVLRPDALGHGASHFIHARSELCEVKSDKRGAVVTWSLADGNLEVAIVDAAGKTVAHGSGDGRVALLVPSLCGDFLVHIRSLRGDAILYTVHLHAPVALP